MLKQELETLQKELQQYLEVSQKWLKWFAAGGERSVQVMTTKRPNRLGRPAAKLAIELVSPKR